ncbi:MAG: class I SAM-dependent methyltransferase [Ignavibacteriales bacterium]
MSAANYDTDSFFKKYTLWRENQYSANELVEKPNFLTLLPDVKNKRILDLGCGFGDYSRLLYDMGAKVVGVDSSGKMIEMAESKKGNRDITYLKMPIERIDFENDSFELVTSNIVIHYIEDIDKLFGRVNNILSSGGMLVFSTEHPTSTASYNLGWEIDIKTGEYLYWRLDNYGVPGPRETKWMDHMFVKYHRTIGNYTDALINNGFKIKRIMETVPTKEDIEKNGELGKYLKRPLYLIISAEKV